MILSRTRKTGSASLASSVSIAASGVAAVVTTLSGFLSAADVPMNSVIRVSILNARLLTDSGGETKLSIESSLLNVGGDVRAPAFSGSPLGLVNAAVLQGEVHFQDVDVSLPADCQVSVFVSNSDTTTAHLVTNLDITLLAEIVTFDQPVYAEGLVPPF